MSTIKQLYLRMIKAMEVEGLDIPTTAVKFYNNHDDIPDEVYDYKPENISITSCQADRQASLGDAVLLNKENIGCIAAAITFGLVDQNDDQPLQGPRVYTDIMKDQSILGKEFKPPTPKDFTEGTVYACSEAQRSDFCLFGEQDSGRYATREIA